MNEQWKLDRIKAIKKRDQEKEKNNTEDEQ
jgi:hypothetical protein